MRNIHPRSNRGVRRTAKTKPQPHAFPQLFATRFDCPWLNWLWRARHKRRRKPLLAFDPLLLGLIYHVLIGAGSLETHIEELTGHSLSGSALSQRRQRLEWTIFEEILARSLQRRANPKQHPSAFYQGWRLLGLDGSRFSLRNTPAILQGLNKAVSRRMKAAFAQVGVVVLVELALHNGVAARIGPKQESELALALPLLDELQADDLVVADRLYGVQKVVRRLLARCRARGAQFLARVRRNLKAKVQQVLQDGSALVEIQGRDEQGRKGKETVREIVGKVWRGKGGKATEVRLWTSLLDAKQYPAAELLALYAQRWEVEITIKELKVEMRGGDLLVSYTPVTAAQEIAALLLAVAVLVEVRCEAAWGGKLEVLRVSFGQTLRWVRALWMLLEVGEGIHTPEQVEALVQRTLTRIRSAVTPSRRGRSCPRAVRQPVCSWPRLLRRIERKGAYRYKIIPHDATKS